MTPPEAPMDNTIRRYSAFYGGFSAPDPKGKFLKVSELAAGLPALITARDYFVERVMDIRRELQGADETKSAVIGRRAAIASLERHIAFLTSLIGVLQK